MFVISTTFDLDSICEKEVCVTFGRRDPLTSLLSLSIRALNHVFLFF